MRDYIDIGSSPCEEDCAQVGSPDYYAKAKTECARFIDLIRRTLGEEPPGAHLAVKSNPHEFGTYYEVVCYFQDDDEEAQKYAYRCESEAPARWDTNGSEPEKPAPRAKVCDSCLTVAYDNGSPGDRETAALVMVELGADLEDHLCDQVEARDLGIKCTCACRRR
mgnify:CR=1 FL=1